MYEYGREWIWNFSHGEITAFTALVGVAALMLHFLPALVAFARSHHDRWAILALNFFLGWTGIGWIIALIWCLTAVRAPAPPR